MDRAELTALTDALADELVPLPLDADDVCPLCRSGRSSDDRLCEGCTIVTGQVDHACPVVIPISYYATPSLLRERMHGFKESDDPDTRSRESGAVAGILVRYLLDNRDDLSSRYGGWDAIVAVPSTKTPPGSALGRALVASFSDLLEPVVECLEIGTEPISFRCASVRGFSCDQDLRGMRVLLVDDTFTTGAHLHSAHHTLTEAGATVVAGIVVARKINPNPLYFTDQIWGRQQAVDFSFAGPHWWTTI